MVPLAAEDTRDPRLDLPKGMSCGFAVTVAMLFTVFLVGTAMPPGIDLLMWEHYPLVPTAAAAFQDASPGHPINFAPEDIFRTVQRAIMLLTLPGLIGSLQSTTFAYGRVFFSLARAGLIPEVFTKVTRHGIPYTSLLLGGTLGLVSSFLLLIDEREFHGRWHFVCFDVIVFSGYIHLMFILTAFVLLRYKCLHVSVYRAILLPGPK